MKLILGSFKESFKLLIKDKWVLLFSTVPLFIGSILYFFLGSWLYGDVYTKGQVWIKESLVGGAWGSFLGYILIGLLTIALFFLINYTFVLVVSIIAGPFNDLISSRVEKLIVTGRPEDIKESIGRLMKNLVATIFNEIKKIGLILTLTILAFILSFFPLFVPISMLLTVLILSIGFVDYSWGRNNLKLGECIKDVKGSFVIYVLAGAVFWVTMAIPIVNLVALPIAVIYYTVIYCRKNLVN